MPCKIECRRPQGDLGFSPEDSYITSCLNLEAFTDACKDCMIYVRGGRPVTNCPEIIPTPDTISATTK